VTNRVSELLKREGFASIFSEAEERLQVVVETGATGVLVYSIAVAG
jgi:hypothetical protein